MTNYNWQPLYKTPDFGDTALIRLGDINLDFPKIHLNPLAGVRLDLGHFEFRQNEPIYNFIVSPKLPKAVFNLTSIYDKNSEKFFVCPAYTIEVINDMNALAIKNYQQPFFR